MKSLRAGYAEFPPSALLLGFSQKDSPLEVRGSSLWLALSRFLLSEKLSALPGSCDPSVTSELTSRYQAGLRSMPWGKSPIL